MNRAVAWFPTRRASVSRMWPLLTRGDVTSIGALELTPSDQ